MSYHVQNQVQYFEADLFDFSLPSIFWREEPDSAFVASLRTQGQLEPVIADMSQREDSGGKVLLLSGYKRVRALAGLGKPVMVRGVELSLNKEEKFGDAAEAIARGLLYLSSNAGHPMDDRKRFEALRYFDSLMPRNGLAKDILPLLGLNARSGGWRQLSVWLDAPSELADAAAAGRAPFALADTFDLYSADDLRALAPYFSSLKWSRGAAVHFVSWLGEAASRDGVSPASVLSGCELTKILQSGLSPKDSIEQLVGAVRALRYPNLGRLERKAADLCQGLVTGTPWRAAHTRNFEDGSVSLSLSVKNRAQLEEAVQSLQTMSGSSLWEKLWSLGDGEES